MNQDLTMPQAPERVLSTLEKDGSRHWLYPRLSKGRFWNRRRGVAYVLLALYTLIPFLHIGGKPVILLDVMQRRFTLLGASFLPTDTALLALFLLLTLVSVFFVTALLGRVWCGWACPQTVYMEFVFRPIERLFTGRAGKGGSPKSEIAGWRKPLMYAVYFVICVHLANTFLAYFVPASVLNQWITSSPANHPAGFTIVVILTALMMFNFAWFREQTCIIACPYGRLQSVLLDRQSLIVSYDTARGEPRTKSTRLNVLPDKPRVGDCVDCSLCVQVCPTGIDIRQGLQVECVGCAQCIDACDAVMDKINRPRGLIRYSSQSAMAGAASRILRPRLVIYSAIIVALASLLSILLLTRSPADVTLLRNLGNPFVISRDGMVENTMRMKITNRTDRSKEYRISAVNAPDVKVSLSSERLVVAPGASATESLLIIAPPGRFSLGHLNIKLRISDQGDLQIDRDCLLLGPISAAASTDSTGGEHDRR